MEIIESIAWVGLGFATTMIAMDIAWKHGRFSKATLGRGKAEKGFSKKKGKEEIVVSYV